MDGVLWSLDQIMDGDNYEVMVNPIRKQTVSLRSSNKVL